MAPNTGGKVYIVEHLDPELGPWSELEYVAIAQESQDAGSSFTLSSLPDGFKVPASLEAIPTFKATQNSVEDIYAANKNTVCLLDPAADKDLSPEDAQEFGNFLFGGILGDDPPRGKPFLSLRRKQQTWPIVRHTLLTSKARPHVGAEEEGFPRTTPGPRPDDHGYGRPGDENRHPGAKSVDGVSLSFSLWLQQSTFRGC